MEITSNNDKQRRYLELVSRRKLCKRCNSLVNPSTILEGKYDSNHIGPWSTWQGNIDSPIVIIGQDWGNPEIFIKTKGLEPVFKDTDIGTDGMLLYLLRSIGITVDRPKEHEIIGNLFFTNAILCLKQGDMQAKVLRKCFENCGEEFLKPSIEIINPRIVITLGKDPYLCLEKSYRLKNREFVDAVETQSGIPIFGDTTLFPMYHCGRRSLNMNRDLNKQLADWRRVEIFMKAHEINVG